MLRCLTGDGWDVVGWHTDVEIGARHWIDALRLPVTEECGGHRERERGEDHIYQESRRIMMSFDENGLSYDLVMKG